MQGRCQTFLKQWSRCNLSLGPSLVLYSFSPTLGGSGDFILLPSAADALRLAPNCPEFSTTWILSLAVDLTHALHPNKKPEKQGTDLLWRMFPSQIATCISKETLVPQELSDIKIISTVSGSVGQCFVKGSFLHSPYVSGPQPFWY